MKTLTLLLLAFLLASCSGTGKPTQTETSNSLKVDEKKDSKNSPGAKCDPTLWQHVYDAARLEVISECKLVTGIIEELDHNEDGDTHMLLRLDPGQEDLLKKKNISKKDGDLVIEVVCANPIKEKKVGAVCDGYSSGVRIPAVGEHVKVTGSFVLDSHNGWTEIHPVTSIDN
ncbi:MAG: hypothetical protein ABJB34_12605 [Acidobacteriota bacterium]